MAELIIGWVLGIASTLGVEFFNRWQRRRRFLAGLRIEFARLEGTMAVLYWNLTDREGAITEEDIVWVMSRTRHAVDDEGVRRFRGGFERATSFSDAEIAALNRVGRQRKELAVSVRSYQLSFLEANLSELANVSDAQTAAGILHVKHQVTMYNEIVADTREYHRMTFDSSLTSDNHQKALTLVEQGYTALRKRAKWTADAVESTWK